MTPTRFAKLLVMLTTALLVAGCISPVQIPTAKMPGTPTSLPLPTAAPASIQTADDQLVQEIDQTMAALVEQDKFSGALLVARDGKVLISKGYGMANIELEVPNTLQTKFRLGSITKQFTALAILLLQQQGKLNVQDRICRYIQDCPAAWQPITIHHLLNHTSGIHNFTASWSYAEIKKKPASPIELIDLFRDLPLDFEPGEKWKYSNSGYIMLGYIIEQVSGRSYASFPQEHIFEPLHMADTGYEDSHSILPQRAAGYSRPTVNADFIDMSVPFAAGGLYSTVEDLLLWDQALYTDKLIPPSLRKEMFTPLTPIPRIGREGLSSDAGVSYGYGWMIDEQFDRLRVAHGGGIDGFATKFDRYPDDRLAIILLSNLETAPVGDIAVEIARMIFAPRNGS